MNKKIIAITLILAALMSGCSMPEGNAKNKETDEPTETSITIKLPDPSEPTETPETTPETSATIYHVNDGDGSQFITDCNFEIADEAQGAGYIPLKPIQVEDLAVRKIAEELYDQGYSLCDLKYMGKAMVGLALISDGRDILSYFNTGIDAELIHQSPDHEGDWQTDVYVIRMTEDQYEKYMLKSWGVAYYINYDFDETGKHEEETDDGTVRRMANADGNYIEYHRDTGICILRVDNCTETLIKQETQNTHYDD